MKKLILIPSVLTACVAPSFCLVCCTKTKESVFNGYVEETDKHEVFAFDSANYCDIIEYQGTVEFNFIFNFNIIPESVLSLQHEKYIMLCVDTKFFDGIRYQTSVMYAKPETFIFKSITYNNIELAEGDPSSSSNCYFIHVEKNGTGSACIGFVLHNFDSSSTLKVKMCASQIIDPREKIPPNAFFVTPAIGFMNKSW